MNNRPVILTVECKSGNESGSILPGANFQIAHMRRMNAVEYAWHRVKKLFTPTPTHTTEVSTKTMNKVGILGSLNVGMEMSAELWHRLVAGEHEEIAAWSWLTKYSSVLLSPVPPSGVHVRGACEEVIV